MMSRLICIWRRIPLTVGRASNKFCAKCHKGVFSFFIGAAEIGGLFPPDASMDDGMGGGDGGRGGVFRAAAVVVVWLSAVKGLLPGTGSVLLLSLGEEVVG